MNAFLALLNIFLFSTSEEEQWHEQSRSFPPEEVNTPFQSTPSYSISPALGMVSRRAIISRSRDDLQHHLGITSKNFTGEDQWFSKEKLYKVDNFLPTIILVQLRLTNDTSCLDLWYIYENISNNDPWLQNKRCP